MSALLNDLEPDEIARIPKRTLIELSVPAGDGERHFQAKRIAIPLLGDGFTPDRVFELLRCRYDGSFSDGELRAIIKWATGRGFTPSSEKSDDSRHQSKWQKPLTPEEKIANAQKFLKEF